MKSLSNYNLIRIQTLHYLSIFASCPKGRWLHEQNQPIYSYPQDSYKPRGRCCQQWYHLPISSLVFLVCWYQGPFPVQRYTLNRNNSTNWWRLVCKFLHSLRCNNIMRINDRLQEHYLQQNSYSISHLLGTVTTQWLSLWRCSHCSLVPDTVTTEQWLHRTHTLLGIHYHGAYVEILLLGT